MSVTEQVAEASVDYINTKAGELGQGIVLPAGYKKTEVGVIPEDWEAVQLKQIFSLKNGYSFKGEFFSNKGPVVLTPGNFRLEGGLYFEQRNTKQYSAIYPKSFEFKNGDLVVVMTDLTPDCNLLGKPAFVESHEKVLHNQRIGKIERLSGNWNKKFLYYTLLSSNYLLTIKNAATGSTVRHTSPTTIYSAWVTQPSKEEQTAIANALSDVDALINAQENLITKKLAIKTATMQQLLTGRTRLPQFALREDGTSKGYKPSELGEVPEDWQIKRIGDFTDCTAGGTPSTSTPPYWGGSNPWMSSGELHLKQVFDVAERITDEGLKNSSTKYIPKDSVLMGLAGQGKTRGTVAIARISLCTNQSIAAIFPSDKHSTEYLFYNLDRRYDELRGLSTGDGGRGGLNLKIIRNLKLPIPSLPEQTAIATILSDMDEEIQTLQQRINKTRQIKQGMMQELLTGKTRLIQENNNG